MHKTIVLFLFFCNLVNAQVSVNIFNSVDKKALPYVKIIVYKNGINVMSGDTDEMGEFRFNSVYDSIVVSSFGFESKKFVDVKNRKLLVYLKPKVTVLDEVKIASKKRAIFIGEYKKKSTETFVVWKEERFAYLFPNRSDKKYKVNSLLLNFKEIPNKVDLVFAFYEIDSVQRTYVNQKNHKETILTEIVPDIKKSIKNFEYTLMPFQDSKIIEINMDSLNLKMPKDGMFVSVFSKNIYDSENNKKVISSAQQLPLLYKHKTKENNYCTKIPVSENYWQNYNLVLRHSEDTDEYHPLISMFFYDPSIAIKVEEVYE